MIVHGSYQLVEDTDSRVYAFTRIMADERLLVVLNFSRERPTCAMPQCGADPLIGNYPLSSPTTAPFKLRPWEAQAFWLH